MSSQLHSGFIWIQAVAHDLVLPWFRVTSLVFLAKHELENSFCDCIFLPKRGRNFDMFMYSWMNSHANG